LDDTIVSLDVNLKGAIEELRKEFGSNTKSIRDPTLPRYPFQMRIIYE
jgi:hypothetical protein